MLKSYLDQYSDEEIVKRLLQLYSKEKKNLEGYRSALKELRTLTPKKTSFQIRVQHYQDEEEAWEDVGGFNLDDPTTPYSLQLSPWREWMGMEFTLESLRDYPMIDLLAHCLWEMTFSGYSNAQVQGFRGSMIKKVKHIKE